MYVCDLFLVSALSELEQRNKAFRHLIDKAQDAKEDMHILMEETKVRVICSVFRFVHFIFYFASCNTNFWFGNVCGFVGLFSFRI